MKLERSINRSAKSTHGIIEQTHLQQYVTEWQLIYHGVLDITNVFREILCSDTVKGETYIHRDLSKSSISAINNSVAAVTKFSEKLGNPFMCSGNTLLKNFVSQMQSLPRVSQQLLNFFGILVKRLSSIDKMFKFNVKS